MRCLSIFVLLAVSTFAERPNVLLICVDDLRPELNCFGMDYIVSPNIDRLASEGRAFHRHYVQAPTCGASRFTLLTGRYGSSSNGALLERGAKLRSDPKAFPPSMPAWFRQNGYTTVSVGKVSHHPGGLGGKRWADKKSLEMPLSWDRHLCPTGDWQDPEGIMHGLAHGEIRRKAKDMDVFQAEEGGDEIYPDGLIVNEGLAQMDKLTKAEAPWFLAVGIIRPHLPFGAPAKYLEPYKDAELPEIAHPQKPAGKTTWHGSGEFMKYNRWKRNPNEDAAFAMEVRKHYAACVTYADALVGRLLEGLKASGQYDKTIIALWGDHGWHLGEHAIWGKHALFEESLRSPLIMSYKGIPKAGAKTESMVETLDIFPTLTDLAGLPTPDYTQGVSLRPILEDPAADGHPAISYRSAFATIRSDRYRLIAHKKGGVVELYDHQSDAGETENIAAAHPEVVARLKAQMLARRPM